MATNAMMIAYSTSPCPFSAGENNMKTFLSNKVSEGLPVTILDFQGSTFLNSPSCTGTYKKPRRVDRVFCLARVSGLRQGGVDGAERITDFGSEQRHHSDHDDGDEREDDRVLDEALAFFFGCKQHGNIPF